MKRTVRYLLIVIGIFIFVIISLGMFWHLATPFYYKCQKLKPGMTTEQMMDIMKPYFNNERVSVYEGDLRPSAKTSLNGPGIEFDTSFLDMRCLMTIDSNIISKTEFYYD